jgi:hypothetical protein
LIEGNRVQKNLYVLALACYGITISAHAQERSGKLHGFEVDAAVDVRRVENAGLQPSSAEQVDETQTISSLGVLGELSGVWAGLVTDFRVEDRRYSEFSQNDDRVLLGDAQLILGPQHRRYYAKVSHSSREVMLDPSIEDVPSNRDSRTMSSGALFGSLQPGQGNLLTLWLEATDIQFEQAIESESERYSVGMNIDRLISPIYKTGLILTAYDLQYRYLESADVVYSRADLVWQADLRNLSYGIQVGTNGMETELDTTYSPTFKLNLAYQSGPQNYSVNFDQFLTDTSQGTDELGDFDPVVGVDGRLDNVVDQFQSRQLLLDWSHAQLCGRCGFAFSASAEEEDYLNVKELSSREFQLRAGLSYRTSQKLGFGLKAIARDFDLVNVIDPMSDDGYREAEFVFDVEFPEVIRDGHLRFYVGTVERKFDLKDGYTSSYIGANFRYELYKL